MNSNRKKLAVIASLTLLVVVLLKTFTVPFQIKGGSVGVYQNDQYVLGCLRTLCKSELEVSDIVVFKKDNMNHIVQIENIIQGLETKYVVRSNERSNEYTLGESDIGYVIWYGL